MLITTSILTKAMTSPYCCWTACHRWAMSHCMVHDTFVSQALSSHPIADLEGFGFDNSVGVFEDGFLKSIISQQGLWPFLHFNIFYTQSCLLEINAYYTRSTSVGDCLPSSCLKDRSLQSLLNCARFELFMLTSLNRSQKPHFGAWRCFRWHSSCRVWYNHG